METNPSPQFSAEKIKQNLKENIMTIFAQITSGCKNKDCYNVYCANNKYSAESKFYLLTSIQI